MENDALDQVVCNGMLGFTCEEVAKLTGRPLRTIQNLCKAGKLPARKLGRSWFIPKQPALEYLGLFESEGRL